MGKHVRVIWILAMLLGVLSQGGRCHGVTTPVPTTPPTAEFPIGNSLDSFESIAAGRDGNVWFASTTKSGDIGKIGKVSASGAMTIYQTGISSGVNDICQGTDGNMWFTEKLGNRIGKITPSGVVTEFPFYFPAVRGPDGIALCADGGICFCESAHESIGTYDPYSLTYASYPIPAGSKPAVPKNIIAGPDGNLWFTDNANSRIGRILLSDGSVTMYSAGITTYSNLWDIAVGPDGNLWFTELGANKIGRFNMSLTDFGLVTEFSSPSGTSAPFKLCSGPDGQLWVTTLGNRVAAITTNPGNTQTSTIYTSSYPPLGICTGPDRNIWFSEVDFTDIRYIGFIDVVEPMLQSISLPAQHVPMSGKHSVYLSVCPSSLQGLAYVRNLLAQYYPRQLIKAFAYDSIAGNFCELPNHMPTDGLNLNSGIFIAANIPLTLNLSGTPQFAPYDTVLHPGWNFFGIPPLMDGSTRLTTHPLSKFSLYDTAGAAITGSARNAVIGSSAYFWDGGSYQSVTALESGKAYWLRNTSAQDVTLVRVNDLTGGIVFLADREYAAGADPAGSASGGSGDFLPPPIPGLAETPPRTCGGGGGAAGLVVLIALIGMRLRGRRLAIG